MIMRLVRRRQVVAFPLHVDSVTNRGQRPVLEGARSLLVVDRFRIADVQSGLVRDRYSFESFFVLRKGFG